MPTFEEILSDEEDDRPASKKEMGREEEDKESKEEREERHKKSAEAEAARVERQFALADKCREDANALFSTGALEEACAQYSESVRLLYQVGNEPENRVKAEKANLVLHLNLAMATLKMEKFEEAKDHATSAWAIDQENVKALYRRAMAQAGIARKASLFQETEAKAACEDLHALLRIEPNNSAARSELQKLRAEIKAHDAESSKKQRETYTNMFGGKADGPDLPVDNAPPPMVRPFLNTDPDRHCFVSAEGVAVGRGRNGPVLSNVDMNLIEKWCIGIYTEDALLKSALVDVLTRKVSPSAGKFTYPRKKKRGVNPDEVTIITTPIMLAVVVGAAAILWGMIRMKAELAIVVMFSVVLVIAVPLVVYMWYEQQCLKRPPIIFHMMRNGCEDWKPSGSKTVAQVLESSLPSKISKLDRGDRASALLRAAGFDKSEDCCLFRDLSEDQKQQVYILRCLVEKSKVIIVDDALRDLEPASQSRMLRMLKRMKQDCNASILFISSDMQQLTLVCDSLGLLSAGKLCELGPTDEVLARPRHPAMKAAIEASNIKDQNSSLVKGSGNVQDFYNDLLRDSALGAHWLPTENEPMKNKEF